MLLFQKIVLENTNTENDDDGDNYYVYFPSRNHLSKCVNEIVAYVAGFVVFKLKKSLHCEKCIDALISANPMNCHSLIKLKSKRNLVYPSDDVIDICVTSE